MDHWYGQDDSHRPAKACFPRHPVARKESEYPDDDENCFGFGHCSLRRSLSDATLLGLILYKCYFVQDYYPKGNISSRTFLFASNGSLMTPVGALYDGDDYFYSSITFLPNSSKISQNAFLIFSLEANVSLLIVTDTVSRFSSDCS